MMTKDEKQAIISQYATHEGDTGSPEVQIAVLTSRVIDRKTMDSGMKQQGAGAVASAAALCSSVIIFSDPAC